MVTIIHYLLRKRILIISMWRRTNIWFIIIRTFMRILTTTKGKPIQIQITTILYILIFLVCSLYLIWFDMRVENRSIIMKMCSIILFKYHSFCPCFISIIFNCLICFEVYWISSFLHCQDWSWGCLLLFWMFLSFKNTFTGIVLLSTWWENRYSSLFSGLFTYGPIMIITSILVYLHLEKPIQSYSSPYLYWWLEKPFISPFIAISTISYFSPCWLHSYALYSNWHRPTSVCSSLFPQDYASCISIS